VIKFYLALSALLLLLITTPCAADETEVQSASSSDQLSAEDQEILEMMDLLEVLELLDNLDDVAALEEKQ
jgi:hypothetical protein